MVNAMLSRLLERAASVRVLTGWLPGSSGPASPPLGLPSYALLVRIAKQLHD
jgi:hypothetical protein